MFYYLYNEAVVYINMYKQSNNSSRSQQFDGNIVDSIDIYSEEIKQCMGDPKPRW